MSGATRELPRWSALLLTALALAGCGDPPERNERATGARVLLVGLDGLDPRLVDRFVADGTMPNLARLISGGRRARIEVPEPVTSPVIWTTVATGVGPATHGVTDWVVEERPASSLMRRRPAFWNLAAAAHRSVASVCWLASWPADENAGIMVTDRAWPRPAPAAIAPPGALDPARFVPAAPPGALESEMGLPAPGTTHAALRAELVERQLDFRRRDLFCSSVAEHLLSRERFDLLAVYLRSADISGHFFWQYFEPEPFRSLGLEVPEEAVAAGRSVIPRSYALLDAELGRLVERAGFGANVIVVSDHGMRAAVERLKEKPWALRSGTHEPIAELILSGPAFAGSGSPFDARHEDVLPTIWRILDLPIAEDIEGRVLESALADEIRSRPARTVASYPPYRSRMVAGGRDEELLTELRALGYIP